MAGLINLIGLISNDVVARIASAGLPPLTDGAIVIGKAKSVENSAPPRIIFIPTTSRIGPPSPGTNASPINPLNAAAPGAGVRSYTATAMGGGYVQGSTTVTISAPDVSGGTQATATASVSSNGAVIGVLPNVAGSGYLNPPTVTIGGVGTGAAYTARLQPTPQAMAIGTARAIYTEFQKFEVRIWGVSSTLGVITPDSALDYDATQKLAHQVIASCQSLAAGVHTIGSGLWIDSTDAATVVDVLGHYFQFTVEFATPVLSEPLTPTAGPSVSYAPANTKANPTLFIQPFGGGTPETP